MSDVTLTVNDREYGGWKSVRITRSIESLAGSFSLDVVDHWFGYETGWVIQEEDECVVSIDDEVVIHGFVDQRKPSFSGTSRQLSYSGRDKSAVLVDCSVILSQWSFRNEKIGTIFKKLAEGFSIKVIADTGLYSLEVPGKIAVNPGEKAFEIMSRIAKMVGVLIVADGDGIIRITRSGVDRSPESLIEGENILSANAIYDMTRRYRNYMIMTTPPGGDNTNGQSLRIKVLSSDDGVTRDERILLIRPDNGMSAEFAQKRVDWEARIRASKSETASITVHGWKRTNGELWTVNEIVYVKSPTLGIDGQMLITQVEFALGLSGETTQIKLTRPDAFEPTPAEGVQQSAGGGWKQPAGGA